MESYSQQWALLREHASETITKSYPLKTVPLQIRPVIIFVLAAWLIVLGMLGMAPIPELPVNDKVLHFFGVSGLGSITYILR
jgi:Na+/pantothenate symporter